MAHLATRTTLFSFESTTKCQVLAPWPGSALYLHESQLVFCQKTMLYAGVSDAPHWPVSKHIFQGVVAKKDIEIQPGFELECSECRSDALTN